MFRQILLRVETVGEMSTKVDLMRLISEIQVEVAGKMSTDVD